MRRSGRIRKQIPILLTGTDVDGRAFSEETATVVLGRHGAGIVSRNKLYPEQELQLRSLESNKEAEIRVVGQIGEESGRYTYGVAFLNQALNFWRLEFPPLTVAEIHASGLSLECSACQAREMLDDGGLESDILATNEGVIRHCKVCGCSTVWREASHAARRESAPPVAANRSPSSSSFAPVPAAVLTAPSPPQAPAPRVNRRKHARAKVNLTACIRRLGFDGDDIVACEDMSRGGIRFRSSRHYYEGAYIEVAVPYTEGAPPLFVPARIVRVEEVSQQGFFRCGVAFLNTTPPRDHC